MFPCFAREIGYTLFRWSMLDILRTISNFATKCQLTLRVDCLVRVSRIS